MIDYSERSTRQCDATSIYQDYFYISRSLSNKQHLVMSEKLCLQWNDFQENVNSAFRSLRNDKEFTNVTLASEDGQEIEAHKVILAASSPIFDNLLQKSKHNHPLIYLRGFESKDFVSILDFVYFGEANVNQEDFDSFVDLLRIFS